MLSELVGAIIQGSLEGIGNAAAQSKRGRFVIGILAFILAIFVTFADLGTSGPGQVNDLDLRKITYTTSYLKGDKDDLEIVLEGNGRKYRIFCNQWPSQIRAWDVLEQTNTVTEAEVYVWKESAEGAIIWGMKSPYKLDPETSIRWSRRNSQFAFLLAGIFYAIGIGFIVNALIPAKRA